jgi:hypothetical protein
MDEFRKQVLKVNGPRKHKTNKSFGVYDSYKWIRKHKWLNIGKPITEHTFYSIIRQVNNELAEFLSRGYDINLPEKMGRLELRKYDARITLQGTKVITNLPIDWDSTLKLWAEDNDAYVNRVLIKMKEREIFRVYYNKCKANYNNKSFMVFDINRELKKELKKNIKEGRIDSFKFND